MNENALAVTPSFYNFDKTEEKSLTHFLGDVDANTIILPVNGPQDLQLNSEYTTNRGYHYTTMAFNQLCSCISKGAAHLLPEIAGMYRVTGSDPKDYSADLACDVLNKLIRLRFHKQLQSIQMVCNSETKLIDGMVGPRYRYLANSDFLSRVQQSVRNQHMAEFAEAGLYGRHIYLRYRWPDTSFTLANGDSHALGIHFANTEIGGSAVRSAGIVIRDDGSCALGKVKRVVHSGSVFERRLAGLLSDVSGKMKPNHVYAENLEHLRGVTLKLGSNIEVTFLRKKLTQVFIKRVISSAMAKGSSGKDTLIDTLPDERQEIINSRTTYDLFAALTREARQLPIVRRELAENIAYSLMMGTFSLE